jgi:CPA2 family monovalent cation:H+ antiporter-2/glutathione-regulated potassium-efflux system ancillary protein KefC
MRIFRRHDQDMMPELYKTHREDKENYISTYQKQSSDLEKLMSMDLESDMEELDKAWAAENPQHQPKET